MLLSIGDVVPALARWRETAGGRATLINHSENQTFRIDTTDGQTFSLRLHRDGYQSRAAIESELAWLSALRDDTSLPIPQAIAGTDGALLQLVRLAGGVLRPAVLFQFVPGAEPRPEADLAGLFTTLGRYAASLHRHAMAWQRPPGFERPTWRAATILDSDGLWGDWRVAPGVEPAVRTLLDRLDAALRGVLERYGTAPDRFGLVHADMRLGNLLVDGQRVTLIDFDDCGFCWFGYDFAAALSFHEARPDAAALKAAWLDGYRRIRAFTAEDVAAMDALVMLRRMALLAWIGSHGDTMLAQTHRDGFAETTAALAERYLSGRFWR